LSWANIGGENPIQTTDNKTTLKTTPPSKTFELLPNELNNLIHLDYKL